MTSRLPVPGKDHHNWGDILNGFLATSHHDNGTLRSSAVMQAGAVMMINGQPPAQNGSVTLASTDIGAISDGDPAGGDLGGTYPNPTVVATHLSAPLTPDQGGTGLSTVGAAGQVLAANSTGTLTWANAPVDWINVVTAYGADPTGVNDSTAAIQNAVNACLGKGGGVVYLPQGTYRVTSTITCNQNGNPVFFQGDSIWLTNILFYGSGDCIYHYDSSTYNSRTAPGGGIRGICIDGTHATGGSVGLHMGDIFHYEVDLRSRMFNGANGKAVLLQNTYYWTEQLQGKIRAEWSTQHIVFDVNTAGASTRTGSFMRLNLDASIEGSGDGVVFQNGTYPTHGRLSIVGNFQGSNTAPVTTAILRLTGSVPAGLNDTASSQIYNCELYMGCEATGTYTPQSIVFASNKNSIGTCTGMLALYNVSPSNNAGQFVNFIGSIAGDASLMCWKPSGRTNITDGGQGISSTSMTNVTGLYGAVVAWTPYRVRALVPYTTLTTAGSPVFGFTGPSTSYIRLTVRYYSANGCVSFSNHTALTGFTGPTLTNSPNLMCEIEGVIMFTAFGNLQLQAASTISGDGYTIKDAGYLELNPIIAS